MWCIGCVLYLINSPSNRAGTPRFSGNFLRGLDGEAYRFVVGPYVNAHELLWPMNDGNSMLKQVFAVAEPYSADTVFSGWVHSALREPNAGQLPRSTVSFVPAGGFVSRHGKCRGGDMRSTLAPGGHTKYYMDLLCYNQCCTSVDQTALHDSPEAAYADASKMGWWKPSTRSWRRARCPKCCAQYPNW